MARAADDKGQALQRRLCAPQSSENAAPPDVRGQGGGLDERRLPEQAARNGRTQSRKAEEPMDSLYLSVERAGGEDGWVASREKTASFLQPQRPTRLQWPTGAAANRLRSIDRDGGVRGCGSRAVSDAPPTPRWRTMLRQWTVPREGRRGDSRRRMSLPSQRAGRLGRRERRGLGRPPLAHRLRRENDILLPVSNTVASRRTRRPCGGEKM